MNEFWAGVLSSVAASCMLAVLGWTLSPTARRRAKRVILKGANAGVLDTFKSQREAGGEIAKHLAGAREIRVLAGRGNELQRETFQALWDGGDRRDVKILLPDPERSGPGSWIDDHQQEAIAYDGGQGDRMIAESIRNNVEYVKNRVGRLDPAQVALYDFPAIGRIVLTEDLAFITPYSDRRHGADSPCVMVASGHALYDFADRIFVKFQQASRQI
ncbi:hypothetical protein ACFWAT_07100 [Streptomyces syringium]|uniref:hypothetical protein n=1 Tax=Streptomyces syringium TaxID=76729 RepID=UPI0036648668